MKAISPWVEIVPRQLSSRIDEIELAAMFLAHASRPLPSAAPVMAHWHSLDVLAKQRWIVRAMRDVAEALGVAS